MNFLDMQFNKLHCRVCDNDVVAWQGCRIWRIKKSAFFVCTVVKQWNINSYWVLHIVVTSLQQKFQLISGESALKESVNNKRVKLQVNRSCTREAITLNISATPYQNQGCKYVKSIWLQSSKRLLRQKEEAIYAKTAFPLE